MNLSKGSLAHRLLYSGRGQVMAVVPALLALLLAASAMVVDMGNLYLSYQELLSVTQAAAKAGGGAMPNPNVSSATSVADQWSGQTSSDYNYNSSLNITSVNVSYACVSVSKYAGLSLPPCISYANACPSSGNPSSCNAIQVTEQATVKTFFAKVFGVNTLNISATASASAAGAGLPYHVVVALDSTASMGQGTDTNCSALVSGSFSPEQCAQLGVQSLLSVLAPGTTTPVDEVALMTFPGLCNTVKSGSCSTATTLTNTVASSQASDDYGCPVTNPVTTSYNNDPAYLIVGFPGGGTGTLTPGDYINSTTGGLNSSSTLVDAVGAGQVSNGGTCNGIQTPGGQGTFYAGAIVAAQQYLTANHTKNIQDIMIFLSDGDAGNGDTDGSVNQSVGSGQIADMNGNLFSNSNQCTQAVNAANWAKGVVQSDGTSTKIYAVSYGSEGSGCTGESYTPCTTMQNISSGSKYFFSVEESNKNGGNTTTSVVCSGAVSGVTGMDQVFTYIGAQLSGSRLIPNSAF